MLNIGKIWTLAVAEMRSCRRLVRTWVFIVVAFLVCTIWYVFMVGEVTWPHPPAQWYYFLTNPGYEISSMMKVFVAISLCGIILLAFDIRARDVKNRIHEIIDSLPVSNFEIVLGRLIGIFLLLLIPCLVFLSLVGCYETFASVIGIPYQIGILPISALSQVAWNLVPNLVLFCALVACLATLVRLRVLVVLIALGLLAGLYWIEVYIPVRFQESVSPFLGNTLVPSDLAPEFVTSSLLGSRFVLLCISIALLSFAASVLPRIEPQRTRYLLIGCTVFVVATLTSVGLITSVYGEETQRETWVNLHRQQSPTAFPDVQHLDGSIELQPGRKIVLDVSLTVRPPTENGTDSVIFSLNPGLKIHTLVVDGTETTNFSFESGILKIPADQLPEESHEIRVKAKGRPDDRFAYLDQTRDFKKLSHENVARLGLRNSIFHRDFVALMPGIVWYPISGTVTDQDILEPRPRDIFTTNLTISVPESWRVATIGKREVVESRPRKKAKFTNSTPVPEIALVAANFDQRTTSIEGVQFEVLFSKKHQRNLNALTPITDLIREWVAARINAANSLSLAYPYETFYVVEIPSTLRIYGGGWQMETMLQPPGMMLIRETTFPTTSFKNVMEETRKRDTWSTDRQERYVFRQLLSYFCNDMQGGNPSAGFARNFVSNQVSIGQRGATSLQYLLSQLSNQLILRTESLSLLSMSKFGARVPELGMRGSPLSLTATCAAPTATREEIAVLPSMWEVLDQTALADLNFNLDPITSYQALLTKGFASAQSLVAHYGAEKLGWFLNQLVTDHRGQTISIDELREVAAKVGINFDESVLPWIEDSVLPGFIVDSPTVSKLAKSEIGLPEFQTTFVVNNAEDMWGYFRVYWAERTEEDSRSTQPWFVDDQFDSETPWPFGEYSHSDPIFLAGHHSKQIAIESSNRLSGIWIDPFLSYNRAPFEVHLPQDNENLVQEFPALPIASDIEWQPQESEIIIVDDLDPQFSIVRKAQDSDEYFPNPVLATPSRNAGEFDQGLRVSDRPLVGEWSRMYDESSYGHYRRTSASIVRGDQTTAARFVATLPRGGYWNLEFYAPKPVFQVQVYGSFTDIFGVQVHSEVFWIRNANPNAVNEYYRLVIKDNTTEKQKKFDISNAKVGWNQVGKFELESTDVEVSLSGWAGHKDVMVFADAIRWTPVAPE